MTFTEFFKSIDWTPLERQAILHFRTQHYLGWGIAKLGGHYEATRRAADAVDYPAYRTDSLEAMARWLFRQEAYADGLYDPDKPTLTRLPTPDHHAHDDRDWQAWDLTQGSQKFYIETVSSADGWKIGYMAIVDEEYQKFAFWDSDYTIHASTVIEFLKLYREATGHGCAAPKLRKD